MKPKLGSSLFQPLVLGAPVVQLDAISARILIYGMAVVLLVGGLIAVALLIVKLSFSSRRPIDIAVIEKASQTQGLETQDQRLKRPPGRVA